MSKNLIVTNQLLDQIEKLPYTEQNQWLFLSQSEEFKGYWEVQGLDPGFLFDFQDLIGSFKLVSPLTVPDFLEQAENLGYQVAFMEDPAEILDAFEYLKKIPDVKINSNLEGNVNGFLPWQITGYNKLIRDESIDAGFFVWQTGAGKSCAIIASILHHMQTQTHSFDIAFVIVKSHNKIDTQRKLKQLGNLESVIIEGDWSVKRRPMGEVITVPGQRQKLYDSIEEQINNGQSTIVIMNYEKLRDDTDRLCELVEGRDCLFFFDEAPTKLANRTTQIYKGTRKILYKKFPKSPRPAWMRHWVLTATPVENSPEDVFSVANLLKPGILGSVTEFYNDYVSSFDFFGKPDSWKNLEAFEAKLQFMTHRVSKNDPEVKKMFPDVISHTKMIDWNPRDLTLYNKLTTSALKMIEGIEDVNILSLIQIMQMMCDAPSMIKMSANNRQQFYNMLENMKDDDLFPVAKGSDIALQLIDKLGLDAFTDIGHTKLATWGEIITQSHPTEKIITHSTWAEYIFPVWEEYLTKLGVSYVIYRGNSKEKQLALDLFRNDPSIRCFLSGDAGSDSIDIAEASVGINYNIPWKWTTLQQREGRRDRVNSTYDQIHTYTLLMPFSVDERKMEICEKKYTYHSQLFDGKAQDEMISSKLTKQELMYLVFGS